jgi:hypothetical protein
MSKIVMMTAKINVYVLDLGKLFLCSLAFIVGAVVGGVVVTILGFQPPHLPEGVDRNLAFLILLMESPILGLAIVLIARGLDGGMLLRAAVLSLFTWVVYTLNTSIESLAFTTTTMEGALFTIISFLFPCIFCGTAAAWLIPPNEEGKRLVLMLKGFFGSRRTGAWIWRLAVAAVIYAPIYLLFGSLVVPLTSRYFQEGMYGLRLPSQEEILLVLLVRSVMFLLACLPIIILWGRTNWSLFLNLGFALFVMVGFLYMLGAYYMPLAVRVPHTLEILAGSFVHAGFLVLLLVKGRDQAG